MPRKHKQASVCTIDGAFVKPAQIKPAPIRFLANELPKYSKLGSRK